MLVTAVRATLRASFAHWLEQGVFSNAASRVIARAHAPFARRAVARPLKRTERIFVVTVGGATLGGSGKTRVALACAHELAREGASVVLIGHRYGATRRLRAARVVSAGDSLEEVGDEALACARSLCSVARVVVGSSRQEAFDFALALTPRPTAIVIDGPLQLAPERSSLSILALDAHSPWGAGEVAPAGDLRAPPDSLLANADCVVSVDATPRAVFLDGRSIDLASFASSLAGSRVGLFTAIARPERLFGGLARAGLAPSLIVRAGDHGPVTPRLVQIIRTSDVDIWLATAKCAAHLEGLGLARPLAILAGSVVLPPAVARALRLSVRGACVGDAPTCVA